MRLTVRKPGKPRPPLRTVTEIAEMLGITCRQLVWALRRDGAPKPVMRANEVGHCVTGNNKVWYEPKEVARWWRGRTDQ